MEVKNGIIIDGELHEAVNYCNDCDECTICSIRSECEELEERCGGWICRIIDCMYFVNRGKVTVTSYREIPKNVGEIYRNGVKIEKGGINHV